MHYDLSLVFPARNEMFLSGTIERVLKSTNEKTEIIVVLDGEWANPPIVMNDRVNIIYVGRSIGQRAATNLGVRLSRAKYVCKLDAHILLDDEWDVKMLSAFKETGDNVVMVSIMRNLWMFSWKCYHCGWKKYQGPTPEKCGHCGKADKIRRKMMWVGKNNPQSTSYCFDSEPHFKYFEAWKHREPYITDKKEKRLTETMSLQGSCFMCTREKYWELELCDEKLGNWGNQGIEVACKTWLSGGKVLCNHNTWYAHLFRTQGGDFSFPWQKSEREAQKTKNNVKELFWKNKWPKQIYPLRWLIEKFWPVTGWTQEDLDKLPNTL
jgi:glycosyltransferase involved in cell wall biosynthesis